VLTTASYQANPASRTVKMMTRTLRKSTKTNSHQRKILMMSLTVRRTQWRVTITQSSTSMTEETTQGKIMMPEKLMEENMIEH